MSLASYITNKLEELAGQWARSLVTLPDHELRAQREAQEAACTKSGDNSPAALVLALLDAEKARREAGK